MFPKNLRPLLPYVKKYRLGYLGGLVCILLTNGIQVLGPKVLGVASDALLGSVTRRKLLFYAGLLLGIAVAKGIFQFLTRWIMAESRGFRFYEGRSLPPIYLPDGNVLRRPDTQEHRWNHCRGAIIPRRFGVANIAGTRPNISGASLIQPVFEEGL